MNERTTKEEVIGRTKKEITQIKMLFASPEGEQVFRFLCREFNDRVSFVGGDPHATSYREGQRSIILFLADAMESEYE